MTKRSNQRSQTSRRVTATAKPRKADRKGADQFVTASDFFTGLLAALKLESQSSEPKLIRVDKKLISLIYNAYQVFLSDIRSLGLKPLFRIHLDPIYEDSEVIAAGLVAASDRNLIRFYNPSYSGFDLSISNEEASAYMSVDPRKGESFRKIARTLLTELSK